ncbi:MAG: tRNA methyltransferase complex GCD14 subunit [Nitrosopumilales archaeon]|nr:MAG: tRNA methyltransferase complex GCD14 subunit [Nitrosopumilales archaeon]
MNKIKNNSYVLFFYNNTKKWLAKISKGKQLHTHIGIISHSDAIGKEYGSRIITNKSKYVYVLEPTIHDFIMKIQHATQIVYPKDLGYIAARVGLESGQKVVEIGTGSGSMTIFLASILKPRGHVYTFDVSNEFMKIAQKNIEKAKMTKYVTMKNLDLKLAKKMPISNVDLVVIDLGDPWSVIPQARKMLKGSGAVVAICPTMNQLEKLVTSFVQNEFTDIECSEHILRTIEAREGKTRHSFQGIGHTTYIAYSRKAFFGREKLRKTRKNNDS